MNPSSHIFKISLQYQHHCVHVLLHHEASHVHLSMTIIFKVRLAMLFILHGAGSRDGGDHGEYKGVGLVDISNI